MEQIGALIGIVSGLISIGTWVYGMVQPAPKQASAVSGYQAGGYLAPPAPSQQTFPPLPPSAAPINPSPAAAPHSTAVSTAETGRRGRFTVAYPRLALASGIYFIVYVIAFIILPSSTDPNSGASNFTATILGLASIAWLGVWIYTIVKVVRLRRWGWLVSVVLLNLYGSLAFAIFGPTTKRMPRPASVAPAA